MRMEFPRIRRSRVLERGTTKLFIRENPDGRKTRKSRKKMP